ncbi:MAG: hypothetical protein A4S09_15010 [Proteobacteria bacterium SG_bin7]|nr:MAG: hypothetical protein A4S09_15010 [Proteobacteria bacterium SG_bin7]
MLDSFKTLSEDLKDHAARLLSMGFLIVVIFHTARFWIRQIGTFNSLNIPISTFAPSVGKELIIGPLIEIVKDLQSFGPMKSWLLGVISTLFVLWVLIRIFQTPIEKYFKGISKYLNDICYCIKACIYLTTPVFFLPKLSGIAEANLAGAVCVIGLHYIVLLKKKPFTVVAMMISLLSGYCSLEHYYSQGIQMTNVCRLSTTIVMSDDGKKFHKGCWISSSNSYVLMRKKINESFTTLAIPRDQIKLISFGVGEGAPQ